MFVNLELLLTINMKFDMVIYIKIINLKSAA